MLESNVEKMIFPQYLAYYIVFIIMQRHVINKLRSF